MTRPSTGPTPADAPASLAALHAQAFPMLSPAQVARVAPYGQTIAVPAGSVLVNCGDREAAFHIVLEGYVEVLEREADGAMHSLLLHRDGEFTGSLDLFTDRPNAVTLRADSASRLLRVDRQALARLCLLYTSPSPRDLSTSRMPSSA